LARFPAASREQPSGPRAIAGFRGVDVPRGRGGRPHRGALVHPHELNDFLLHEGGHIGYGVLPPFRGNGYAGEILRQSLELARALGIDDVLLCCDDDNAVCARVIERAGGELESVVTGHDGEPVQRYWIRSVAPRVS
jgi:predicted acetyltransferase